MNPRKITNLIAQLNAIRSSAEAAIAILEEDIASEEKSCKHPKNLRIDFSTMGNESWRCGACGYVYRETETEVSEEK